MHRYTKAKQNNKKKFDQQIKIKAFIKKRYCKIKSMSKKATKENKRPAWQGGSRSNRGLHFTPGKVRSSRFQGNNNRPRSALKARTGTPPCCCMYPNSP